MLKFLLSTIIINIFFSSIILAEGANNGSIKLTNEETKWLESNKDRTFVVGVTPQLGFEYFDYNGEDSGYMKPLLNKMNEDLGIKFTLKESNNWSEVYSGLQEGNIDILYGANETPERSKTMAFTKPFLKTPYAIISKKGGPIDTIGDIDNRRVGFLQNDFVLDALPKLYKNISYSKRLYKSREEGIEALNRNDIDAFISNGGPIVYSYIYKNAELSYAFKINAITSDMNFSSRINDKVLIDILDKEITYLQKKELPEMISKAQVNYNLKIINLSTAEKMWLNNDGAAVVGITNDYLPFDYYENGDYKGIDGNIIKEIAKMTGIKFTYNYSDFDDLTEKLKREEINVLNIAKTDERLYYVIYPQPFSTERDIIVGRKEEKDVRDIFGLEGKRVAVIKGFWHKDLLIKNLTNVKIIETNDIQESMKLVNEGKADYLIENPTVVRYYTEELQYYDLVQRGNTSTDSFLYFGVSKNKPELASIINKIIPLMDIEELSQKGYEEVPHTNNKQSKQILIFTIIGLVFILVAITLYVIKLIKDLIKEKTEIELLKQREYLLSIDTLTELHNRNYLNSKVLVSLDDMPYPQVLITADVNGLKIINDNYGHQAGDMLLKSFAEALREACPSEGQLFRVGGDEFQVILTNSSEKMAAEVIKRITETAEGKAVELKDGSRFPVAAALGFSIRYSKNISFDELSEIADMNMYSDKRNKKDIEKKNLQ